MKLCKNDYKQGSININQLTARFCGFVVVPASLLAGRFLFLVGPCLSFYFMIINNEEWKKKHPITNKNIKSDSAGSESIDILKEGYIKIYKKIIKSAVWNDSKTLQLWIYCLLRANFEAREIYFAGQTFKLKKGQFISSINNIAKDCNLTIQQTRSRLILLKNPKMPTSKITIKTTNKFSLITVINYTLYQDRNKQNNKQTNKPATNQQQQSNNNNKNINKENLFFKKLIKSVSNFENILGYYYLLKNKKVENENGIKKLIKSDILDHAHELKIINTVKINKVYKIMDNLRANNRLTLANTASVINTRAKAAPGADINKRLGL